MTEWVNFLFIRPSILALLILVQFFFTTSAKANENVFVSCRYGTLFSQPKLGAEILLQVKSGTQLPVILKSGSWLQVIYQGTKGWIPKLMVSPTKPLGKVSPMASANLDLSKTARKRASALTTSAASRGLLTDRRRANKGDVYYQDDTSRLEPIEQLKISETEVIEFLKEVRQ